MQENSKKNIIIYNTADGKASVDLYAKDGNIWMSQNQLAELFATSVPNISMHISNILKEGELEQIPVIKDYLTTASDGKDYNVTFYSLDMSLTSWKGSVVRKQDIFIAKNYLTEDEIDTLNRLVVIFLESAELRAKNRMDITMDFWRQNVDKILDLHDKKILNHAGFISKIEMEKKVKEIYTDFDKRRKEYEAIQADNEDIKELKQIVENIKHKK